MTNPSPRPALRKAADADVHPAAPRPARSPRARSDSGAVSPVPDARATPTVEAVTVEAATQPGSAPLTPPKKRNADPAKSTKPARRKFSGSTSDHLRVPDVAEVAPSQRAALDHLFENVTTPSKTPKAKESKAAGTPKPVDLMGGKQVELEAKVPKNLRKAARVEAKKRGLDVDTVVTDLLHAWLTGRG